MVKVGVIGSGFMSKGLTMTLASKDDVGVSFVLTRSNPSDRGGFPLQHLLTCSVQEVIDHSDLVVECSGDVVYATEVLEQVLKAGLPVITLDPALHITTGTYLRTLGWISEAEGDQPGCLAALTADLTECGFSPIVYGNIKGFLNRDPTYNEMKLWSQRLGISMKEVTANTDGTKVQIEQALVANWFCADIACEGMLGIHCKTVGDGAFALTHAVNGRSISDYIIPQYALPGVFIVATCDDDYQHPYLRYLKLGDGPYLFSTNYHLCHLEVIKTIRRWQRGDGVLMDNGECPTISVGTITRRDIRAGEKIDGIGSFDVRGQAVRISERPRHVPIGLMQGVRAKKMIPKDRLLTLDDVLLPNSLALRAWCEYHVGCK